MGEKTADEILENTFQLVDKIIAENKKPKKQQQKPKLKKNKEKVCENNEDG